MPFNAKQFGIGVRDAVTDIVSSSATYTRFRSKESPLEFTKVGVADSDRTLLAAGAIEADTWVFHFDLDEFTAATGGAYPQQHDTITNVSGYDGLEFSVNASENLPIYSKSSTGATLFVFAKLTKK